VLVDELLGQQQIVIKSLETNFRRMNGLSGATILGDGRVALILDVPGLIKLARQNAYGPEFAEVRPGGVGSDGPRGEQVENCVTVPEVETIVERPVTG
jgi:chemotaxis protein histidine kinase CheA